MFSQAQEEFIKSYCREKGLRVELVFKRPRKTKLGDHRWDDDRNASLITVNTDPNGDRLFFVTLHELAHAEVCQTYSNWKERNIFTGQRLIAPHGIEWQQAFGQLILAAIQANLFSTELIPALTQHARSPKANTHSDPVLLEALREFDSPESKTQTVTLCVKDLNHGELFFIQGNKKRFQLLELRRTRYLCKDDEGKQFTISATAPVERASS